ncbi:MAG: hypothetical protein EZS26_001986 [Candidatus Ordinivivax streblomastigis]|uniref:Uncharacterized protein n=1 Tax=Candidatus Ordinivivax streblomastigis TaxID=2540710 RepID=A0A5M8P075_9BACT|nr:MAG: hypothetical protein EZS26_001986 [Candidatus Ordinivivax streblomastigis]
MYLYISKKGRINDNSTFFTDNSTLFRCSEGLYELFQEPDLFGW